MWKAIDHEQPPGTGYVLVACKGGSVESSFFCKDADYFDRAYGEKLPIEEYGRWSNHFSVARRGMYCITHCMPLPPPPKEE